MSAKVVLAAAAAGLFAAVLVMLPQPYGAAVVVGCGVFVFSVYVLRERAAIRGLFQTVRRLERNSKARFVAVQAQDTQDRTRIEEGLAGLSRRLESVKELSELNAAALNEIVGQQRRQHESLDHIRERLDRVEARALSTNDLRRVRDELVVATRADFRQLEALTSLHALFSVRAPLPPSRKWAASPDVLLYLTSLVMERHPRTILEVGSGLSTLWLAYAVEKSGQGGHVISLDHDEKYVAQTRSLLAAHGLSEFAEVRHAPISDLEIGGEVWPWYDPSALADVQRCDLVFIDGPVATIREKVRYPALPVLMSRLAPNAVVVMVDCIRQDEKEILGQWSREYPEWAVTILDHEKGTAVLSRSVSDSL